MPISRKEFEKGERDASLLVEGFLRANSDYAFTLVELVREMASRGTDLTQERVQSILGLLEASGRIESEIRYGEVYYFYCGITGFRRPRRRL